MPITPSPNLGISHFRVCHLLFGAVLQDEPIGCPGCLELRNCSASRAAPHLRICPNRRTRKSAEEGVGGWRGRGAAGPGSGGEGSLLSPICLWSVFLHMALVFPFRQPAGAQPRPGPCGGELMWTDAGGKCVCACLAAVCFLCGVAVKEREPQGTSFLLCSVLARSSLDMW